MLFITLFQKIEKGFFINKLNKIVTSKAFQTLLFFSVFRAIYGAFVVLFFYYFGYRANVGIEIYILYILISIIFSRFIFKGIKKRFNL